MKSILKHTILLIAVVLLSVGTTSYSNGVLLSNVSSSAKEKNSDYFFSEGKSAHYCTPRQNEVISIVGHGLSSENSPKNTSSIWGYAPTFEQRVKHIAGRYIFRSYRIYRSLTVSDIIYPFSYFW